MKITLEFDALEDKFASRCAFLGTELYRAISDIDGEMRRRMKYNQEISDDEIRFLERMREIASIVHWIEEGI